MQLELAVVDCIPRHASASQFAHSASRRRAKRIRCEVPTLSPVEPRIELTTRKGTHTFSPRDRLWVSGDPPETRTVTNLNPGDLVAFLGRVTAVRVVSDDFESEPDAA